MGDGIKAAKSAATGPTPAQLREMKHATARANGTIFIGGAGHAQMMQRCARAGWGAVHEGKFTINDSGRRMAKEGGA